MSITLTERPETTSPDPVRSRTGRLRLRLKSAHRSCGYVQGAWWPRSTRLTAEIPPLLAALTPRLGPIERVSYHENDWSVAPSEIDGLRTELELDAGAESPHAVTVCGEAFGRLTLLVVPPYTDPGVAYTAVITAASPDDASTPEQLLGLAPRQLKDHHLTRIAMHRWETEGGAVYSVAT